jgi:hypothetical protein
LSRVKIIREEMTDNELSFFSVYIETKNSIQIYLSEGETKLGTLAVGMPQPRNLIGSPLSSVLIGDRNTMITRLFAEYLAKKIKKISLVSVFIKSVNEKEALPIFRKLIDATIKKENKQK